MASEFRMDRRVEFAETDMAGILHFSNFFRYMEEVEHAFFRSLGLRVHTSSANGTTGWARGKAECRFKEPLRYDEIVELHLFVRDKREKTISYEIVFKRKSNGAEVARGQMTVVCIADLSSGGRLAASPMPREVDAAIDVATT